MKAGDKVILKKGSQYYIEGNVPLTGQLPPNVIGEVFDIEPSTPTRDRRVSVKWTEHILNRHSNKLEIYTQNNSYRESELLRVTTQSDYLGMRI